MTQARPEYQLLWCHDVRAAARFCAQILPEADVTVHRSRKYAEIRHDGTTIALAATDIAAKSRPRLPSLRPMHVADAARDVIDRAQRLGAALLDERTIEGPGVRVALA